MARRNNNKMTRQRKMEPAVLTLSMPTASVGGGTPAITEFVDLSQVCSLINRRFYRQGLNWAVGGIKILTQTGFTGSISTSKLPSTWVMSNAWHKSFAAWQQMNNEALAETESVRPRFLDFKVYADHSHHTAGFAANLMPLSQDGTGAPALPATQGEWEASKVSIPYGSTAPGQSVDRELLAVGPSYPGISPVSGANAVSIIEGYASSRGLPNVLDPNVPDDSSDAEGTAPQNWMAALSNKGTDQTEEVLENMITENNIAPYPFENDGVNNDTMYPGGANQLTGLEIHDVSFVNPTTVGGHTRIKGGMFPCGLIRFDIENTGSSSNTLIQIELVPGTHRGYLAEPMQDM
jgi:hypothetical protein